MNPRLLLLATLCALAFHSAFGQVGPYGYAQMDRPTSWMEYLFPATMGRSDLIPAAQEGGLYAAYGIAGVVPQVAMHPRVQGPLRMLGGGMETLGGGYFTAQTAGFGGLLGGGVLGLNGIDNIQAGLRMTTTGQYQQAVMEQGLTNIFGPRWGAGVYAATQLGMAGVPWAGTRINALLKIPGVPSSPPIIQTTILGENMVRRVMPYADATGSSSLGFGTTPEIWELMSPKQRWKLNDGMLRARIARGGGFRSIGADPLRPTSGRAQFDLTGSELLRLDGRGIPYDITDPVNVYEILGHPIEVLGR